jgi:dethiobiotin synthetase
MCRGEIRRVSATRFPYPGLFIAGTDTGVGKTFVGGAIGMALRGRGLKVGVMKPVESGCELVAGDLVPADAEHLRETSGCGAPLSVVCPYRLAEPLAPALAAERAAVQIDLRHIRKCFSQLQAGHEVVLVESAGGLLTPLTNDHTMRDLAVAMGLPLIVVARNVLGAINHTALTIGAAREAGLTILGIVLNDTQRSDAAAARTNAESLRRWGGAPLLAVIQWAPALDLAALAAIGEPIVAALTS